MLEPVEGSKVTACQQKLVRSRRTKCTRPDNLALPGWNTTINIENWIDEIDIGRHVPSVILDLKKDTVVPAHVPIHAARRKGILACQASLGDEMADARDTYTQQIEIGRTANGIDEVTVRRRCHSGGSVIKTENLSVKQCRSGI